MGNTKASDATATIGTILDQSGQRDAIHVAVTSVVAGQRLRPGDDVGFLGDGTAGVVDNPIGIVDPFLKEYVKKGDRFWLAVYPRKITSLRHVWSHPEIPDEGLVCPPESADRSPSVSPANSRARSDSEDWIRSLADRVGVSYPRLMDHAELRAAGEDDYLVGGAEMEGECVPDGFWHHYEIVTGDRVPEDRRENFFSCSC